MAIIDGRGIPFTAHLTSASLHEVTLVDETHFSEEHPDWFTFEPLPAYSLELNPVEQCWNHTKCADLANFILDDTNDLFQAIDESITQQKTNNDLLHSFFKYSKQPLNSTH